MGAVATRLSCSSSLPSVPTKTRYRLSDVRSVVADSLGEWPVVLTDLVCDYARPTWTSVQLPGVTTHCMAVQEDWLYTMHSRDGRTTTITVWDPDHAESLPCEMKLQGGAAEWSTCLGIDSELVYLLRPPSGIISVYSPESSEPIRQLRHLNTGANVRRSMLIDSPRSTLYCVVDTRNGSDVLLLISDLYGFGARRFHLRFPPGFNGLPCLALSNSDPKRLYLARSDLGLWVWNASDQSLLQISSRRCIQVFVQSDDLVLALYGTDDLVLAPYGKEVCVMDKDHSIITTIPLPAKVHIPQPIQSCQSTVFRFFADDNVVYSLF